MQKVSIIRTWKIKTPTFVNENTIFNINLLSFSVPVLPLTGILVLPSLSLSGKKCIEMWGFYTIIPPFLEWMVTALHVFTTTRIDNILTAQKLKRSALLIADFFPVISCSIIFKIIWSVHTWIWFLQWMKVIKVANSLYFVLKATAQFTEGESPVETKLKVKRVLCFFGLWEEDVFCETWNSQWCVKTSLWWLWRRNGWVTCCLVRITKISLI